MDTETNVANEQTDNSLLASVRLALRRSGTEFDAEISDIINAGRLVLIGAGIRTDKAYSEEDPLIRQAIRTYAKATFGIDNPESEKYTEAFNMMLNTMMGRTDYIEGEGDGDCI